MLPVVMQHGEVQRVDALEILGIERVLRADPVACFGAEIGLQESQHRAKDRQAWHAQVAAMLLQALRQILVQQRVQHDAGRFLDLRQHAIKLFLGAHQRVGVFHRLHGGVLRGGRPSDRCQRFAGRVRHEVQVKIAAAARGHERGKACESVGRRPCRTAGGKHPSEGLPVAIHIWSIVNS
jgi:hypothetical protein